MVASQSTTEAPPDMVGSGSLLDEDSGAAVVVDRHILAPHHQENTTSSLSFDSNTSSAHVISGPLRNASVATAGWFIALMIIILFLLLILIIVCIIKRNRGGKYPGRCQLEYCGFMMGRLVLRWVSARVLWLYDRSASTQVGVS